MAQLTFKALPCSLSAGRKVSARRAVPSSPVPLSLTSPQCTSAGLSKSVAQGQRCSITARSTAPDVGQPSASLDLAKVAELVRGCRTVLAELQGLDFSKSEVRLYFAQAIRTPKGFDANGADMKRASEALNMILKVDADGDPLPTSQFKDVEALALTQSMLGELWRWRRRGGGMSMEEEMRPHQLALADIQSLEPKPIEDIDRTTSSLLDSLPISDQEKKDMSGGMQKLAIGAFQGAVWGSLIFGMLSFVLFNFLRAS